MMQVILDFMRITREELSIPVGKVLEVGSLDVNGTPRSVIQDLSESYVGVDISPGKSVDLVISGENLTDHFPLNYFDTVICCETLEHTIRHWVIIDQMKKVLRPGGHLWISTPTYGFPLHRFPIDCYRFEEDAYVLHFFSHCQLLRLLHVKDTLQQPAIVAVGIKL